MLAWGAFPATLMIGSVVHDGVPVALAAIHAGDWLIKLVVVATVLVKLLRQAETSYASAGCGSSWQRTSNSRPSATER